MENDLNANDDIPTRGWRHTELTLPDGHRIHAEVCDGDGPVFVLIPGTWGNALTRGPLLAQLDARFQLVCVALGGQDDNWPPPKRFSIPQFGEAVLALCDHLGFDRFFVGGHSLGGMISIDMLRAGPDRVRGVVAMEGWTHWRVKEAAFDHDVDSTLAPGQRRMLAEVRHKLVDRWEPTLRDAFCRMWMQWDGWSILESTDIPVLELWGDRGRTRPCRDLLRIPDRPNIRLEWIAGVSHDLPVEAPEQAAVLINQFIKECS